MQLFDKGEHGSWGLEMRAISAAEAIWEGYPGAHLFGEDWGDDSFEYPVAMWPDGNASAGPPSRKNVGNHTTHAQSARWHP